MKAVSPSSTSLDKVNNQVQKADTLLVSKKAGSHTEPLRPLLDKMWTSSGAVLRCR